MGSGQSATPQLRSWRPRVRHTPRKLRRHPDNTEYFPNYPFDIAGRNEYLIPRDRPADEIEVTEEMIRAGAKVARSFEFARRRLR